MLTQPLRLNKYIIPFVNSMSDLFHEDVPFEDKNEFVKEQNISTDDWYMLHPMTMQKLGKKAAGNLIDGKLYQAYPILFSK